MKNNTCSCWHTYCCAPPGWKLFSRHCGRGDRGCAFPRGWRVGRKAPELMGTGGIGKPDGQLLCRQEPPGFEPGLAT